MNSEYYILALLGVFFALFRELSEHAKENRFIGYPDWWNTSTSYRNKHEWRPSWAFKTFLVWITDAEHFFQILSFLSAITAVWIGGTWEGAISFYLGAQTLGAIKPLTKLK